MQLTARDPSFLLKSNHQIETVLGTRAAIGDVAQHHEVAAATDPPELIVHQVGLLKDGHHLIVGTVNIAHDHYAIDSTPMPSGTLSCDGVRCRKSECGNQDNLESKPVRDQNSGPPGTNWIRNHP